MMRRLPLWGVCRHNVAQETAAQKMSLSLSLYPSIILPPSQVLPRPDPRICEGGVEFVTVVDGSSALTGLPFMRTSPDSCEGTVGRGRTR
jgi:hypothetical protein